MVSNLLRLVKLGEEKLKSMDNDLENLLNDEVDRQNKTLSLVASCCPVHPQVLYAMSSTLVNVTAEGFPGKRYHAGCDIVDKVENLAIERACEAFGAQYASVQPHSASNANYQVLSMLLNPGDTLLGMDLDHGGHLTHGSKVTLSGSYYNAIGYHIKDNGEINYDEVAKLAQLHHPKVIICGATAFTKFVDFKRFREIADSIGAILIADISHISGLVITGRHPSPIDEAHITTTCTHKQLLGPRGGLILTGKDAKTNVPNRNISFEKLIQKSVFPWMQGAPAVNIIAGKAAALKLSLTKEFDEYIGRIREIADCLSLELKRRGFKLIGNGTNNHTILVELGGDITGIIAEKVLEECSIIINKNRIPGEKRNSFITSGLRIGTGGLAQRYINDKACEDIAKLLADILDSVKVVDEKNYKIDFEKVKYFRGRVEELCEKYPIRDYIG